jgi:hypothetical protein
MLTVSVCYSSRSGPDFASCTLGGVELGAELLDQPAVLAAAIRKAYDRCREAVGIELAGRQAAALPVAPVVPPPGPAPAAEPVHYYDDRRPADRPPVQPAAPPPAANGNGYGPVKTGKQLGGWLNGDGALIFPH